MPKKNRRSRRSRRQPGQLIQPKPLLKAVTVANMGYFEYITLTEAVSGVGAYYSFRLNDLFDPNFTGTGAQPVAFDQLCQLYSRFRVLQVAVDVELANAANTVVIGVVFPSSASTLPGGCQAWPLQPYAATKVMSVATGGSNMFVSKRTYKIWNVLGITKSQYMNDLDFTCTGTNSPLRAAYLHVGSFTRGGAIGIAAGMVRFSYLVECSQPVLNDLS